MRIESATSDDYALVRSKDESLVYYYGYEHTVGQGDKEQWCFVVIEDGKVVVKWSTEFLRTINYDLDGVDLCEYLFTGMFYYHNVYLPNLETEDE